MVLTFKNLRFLEGLSVKYSTASYEGFLSSDFSAAKTLSRESINFAMTDGLLQLFVGVLGNCLTLVSELIFLVITVGILFFVDPLLAIVLVVVFGSILFLVNRLVSKRILSSGNQNVVHSIEGKKIVSESKLLFREIITSGRTNFFVDKFALNRRSGSRALMKMNFLQLFPKYFLEFLTLALGFVLLFANSGSSGASVTIGKISIYLAAISRLVPAVLRLQTSLVSIQSGMGGASTTLHILGNKLTHVRARKVSFEKDVDSTSGINIQNLSFTFPGEGSPLFSEVSFMVKPKSLTALVGLSGAGKSTLLDLLMGFREDYKGSITIEGSSPADYLAEHPGDLGFIPQEIILVDGTVRENIALGVTRDEVNESDLQLAVEQSLLGDLISDLKDGLNTKVEENGARFSGGQRQRIVIARALYTQPKYLFLDEPTSALDSETEASFLEILSTLKSSKTIFIISHRKGSLEIADQRLLLEERQIKFLDSNESLDRTIEFLTNNRELL